MTSLFLISHYINIDLHRVLKVCLFESVIIYDNNLYINIQMKLYKVMYLYLNTVPNTSMNVWVTLSSQEAWKKHKPAGVKWFL